MVLMLLYWLMLILGDSYPMMGSQDKNEGNLVTIFTILTVHYFVGEN